VARRRGRLVATGLVACALGAATAVAWATTGETDPPPAAPEPVALAPAALFAAKGCAACHVGPGEEDEYRAGPDLRLLPAVAARRVPGLDAAAYVRQSLGDPGAFLAPTEEGIVGLTMPRIALTAAEVDALVAYLLAPPS
jgi:cytochrome c1